MNALRLLRAVSLLEGASFVLLLFVAMPLKYGLGMPLAVRIVGAAHGALFVAYVLLVTRVAPEQDWSLRDSALAVLAALLPFGPFVFDRRLRREIEAAATGEARGGAAPPP